MPDQSTRTVLERFPVGGLRGSWPADEDIVCTVHGPNTDEDQEDDPEGRADLEEQYADAVRE